MSLSRNDVEEVGFRAVILSHFDWISRMPWEGVTVDSTELLEAAMTHWIDEYSGQFSDLGSELSRFVDPNVCGGRILTVISGPAKGFVAGHASSSPIYLSVFSVLERHRQTRPSGRQGADEVRDQYRVYGCDDAVRHSILASAVQVGLDAAIRNLFADLEPLKRYLFGKFGCRAGFQTTEDVWQEATSDIVLSKIRTFRGGGTLISWAKIVIGREISRRLIREHKTVSIESTNIDVTDASSVQACSDDIRSVWNTAWSTLTGDEQFVLMQLSRGWSGEDIARALGVHPGNVSRKLKSGADKLRRALLDAGESVDSVRPFLADLVASPSAEASS